MEARTWRPKKDFTRACFFASFASFASCRRVDRGCVRVSVNQLIGVTLYAIHTYVTDGIEHIVAGGNPPPRVHFAPLAVLSPGPRLAGALSRGTQVLRAIPLEIGEQRQEIVARQTRGVVAPGFPVCSDVYWSDGICLRRNDMWLKLGGPQAVSGARLCATLRDYLSVFQASVQRCTTDGNRIVFPSI